MLEGGNGGGGSRGPRGERPANEARTPLNRVRRLTEIERLDVSEGCGAADGAASAPAGGQRSGGHPGAGALVAAVVPVRRPARGWRIERRMRAQMQNSFVFVGRQPAICL